MTDPSPRRFIGRGAAQRTSWLISMIGSRIASVLAKREVLAPRMSVPSQGRPSSSLCHSRRAASRRDRAAHGERDDGGSGHPQKVAQPDQTAREQGQALARLLEYLHDLRHDTGEQSGDDQDRDHADERRVEQGEADLVLERLARVSTRGSSARAAAGSVSPKRRARSGPEKA